ncbi:hypothetical protein GWN91_06475 [Candidatus Saccharibacteria bacterium]|nr:hypothetical protein [Candidatus Saccharibacteria bacterium]NIW80212.1 hypothetical protein [Calditrichia bacterium]
MQQAFQVFMNKIIDYAGLFPPAKLSMGKAFLNYSQYRQTADNWMLSRFICPAKRLNELNEFSETILNEGDPFNFSVLGRGGKNAEDWLGNLETDLSDIASFNQIYGDRAIMDVFEVRLPPDIYKSNDAANIYQFLNSVADIVEKNGSHRFRPFYEIKLKDDWKSNISATTKALSKHNRHLNHPGKYKRYSSGGFKLRCGGVEPQLYPSPEQVAFAIAACRDQQVALKATAGLHRPLRHYNQQEQVHMHGFLNVFGAGILAAVHQLDTEQIQKIIEDRDRKHFSFTETSFSWNYIQASLEETATARRRVVSFGSCSFDEPREDLHTLGLI